MHPKTSQKSSWAELLKVAVIDRPQGEGWQKASEIAKEVGQSSRNVRETLKKAEAQGLIDMIEFNKIKFYRKATK